MRARRRSLPPQHPLGSALPCRHVKLGVGIIIEPPQTTPDTRNVAFVPIVPWSRELFRASLGTLAYSIGGDGLASDEGLDAAITDLQRSRATEDYVRIVCVTYEDGKRNE